MGGPMPGAAAQGNTALKVALEALQKALPLLPMGSELHTSVLKAVTDISKRMGAAGGGKGEMLQELAALAKAQTAAPPAQAPAMMAPPPPPPAMGMGG